jgi:hypothetical protein
MVSLAHTLAFPGIVSSQVVVLPGTVQSAHT